MDVAVLIDRNDANPFTLIINHFDTVPQIKMKIHKMKGIPTSRQTLIFQGQILTDDFDILRSNIDFKSRIQLIVNNEFPPPANHQPTTPAAEDHPVITAENARLYDLDTEFKYMNPMIEDLWYPPIAPLPPPPAPLEFVTTTTGRNAPLKFVTTTTGRNAPPPPATLKFVTTTTGRNAPPPPASPPPAPLKFVTKTTGRNDPPPPAPLKFVTTTTGRNEPPPPPPTPSAADGSNQNPAADSNPNSKRPRVSEARSNPRYEEPTIRVVVDFRGVRTPVAVMRDDTVASLREKLKEMAVNVPEGPYFFVHGQNTMEDERSYEWHRVAQGDEILLFPGYIERR